MQTKTHIIATIGPSTESTQVLSALIDHGATIVRLNFSWGTHENMEALIAHIREASKKRGVHIPILQDLSGPRMVLAHGHKINEESKEVITEKDLYDLAFGLDHAVEYVAMSYVASAKDIHTLREHMVKRGAVTPIIAKIERKEALDNLEEICEASDGIMIARGDLGLALPIEEVPFIERKILKLCNQKGKFVIVATEMLLSMVESPTPTRAEVNDVATAVELGANAVMLSEETARGKYPIEAVTMMKKIVTFAEQEMHAPKYDL